jgi:hypothetical protein
MTALVLGTRALELLADRNAEPQAAQNARDMLTAAARESAR